MESTGVSPPPVATVAEPLPRRRLIFAIVSIALFMASIDATIVASALPSIQADLGARVTWSGWTITIYMLGQVLTMPVAGRISELYGRKKVLLIAVALFTVASLACGFADDIGMLVVLRAVQSVGGGAFMPSATGIVAEHFGEGRDRALGMFTSILPVGGLIGPVTGGLFAEYWSWRGIFLVNVPIGIALILLGARFLPASEPRPGRKIDLLGVLLLGVMVLAGMFGITYLGNGSVSLADPVFLACEGTAIVVGVLFVRHAKRHEAPFIPLELVRGRGFGVMNLFNVVFGACAVGFGALVPLYAEHRFGIHAAAAGTLLTARAVGSVCVAGLAVLALRRTGHRLPMLVGYLCTATGLVCLSFAPHGVTPYLWLSIAAGITGIGMGMSMPASNNASLQLAPDQAAAIAGLRGMFRLSGSITAVSVATAIIARSSDPGMAQAYVFVVFAGVMVAVLPLLRLVPDHRGSW
ncbi:MFS transporter [Amycolatopsis pigmentata]|uniref:MFS transporter n=1 Tax=Amycolatopsis pigmentata TaxID=450801 RepID=A0ABW5G0F4_9PSEU